MFTNVWKSGQDYYIGQVITIVDKCETVVQTWTGVQWLTIFGSFCGYQSHRNNVAYYNLIQPSGLIFYDAT